MNAIAAAVLLCVGLTYGQGYPAKPVTLIIPFPPGGSTDIIGRIVKFKFGRTPGANGASQ